jgi:hypothetical protein
MREVAAVVVAVVVVLAGCAAPVQQAESGAETTTTASTDPSGDEGSAGDGVDESEAALGVEGGVAWNESIDVNQSDGLSDAELARYVNRTMARVERIRGLEFRSRVPVEVMSREEYRESRSGVNTEGAGAEWRNQVWEATFAIGEDASAAEELDALYTERVLGFYVPSSDRIVVISESEQPVVPNGTLAHELVHALQNQHGLAAGGRTLDGRLAAQGLTEGDARYVEKLYVRRCGDEWDCVATPPGAGFEGGGGVNLAMLFTILHPYADGSAHVHRLRERGGWDAVTAAYDSPPTATSQVIHANRTGPPADVTVRDATSDGWERFGGGQNTIGEAGVYVMLWYGATHHRADTGVAVGDVFREDEPFSLYDYDATESAGWAGDALVPYRNGDRFGYVWATEWESPEDAREFRDAYLGILRSQDAEQRGPNTWVVPNGSFADAFRVTQDGTRVTVVNAPTEDELDDVHGR